MIMTPTAATSNNNAQSSSSSVRNRVSETISFDSRLNVLIPRRVECLRRLGLRVEDLVLSTHCMAAICSVSGDGVGGADGDENGDYESWVMGKTLFELENEQKTIA